MVGEAFNSVESGPNEAPNTPEAALEASLLSPERRKAIEVAGEFAEALRIQKPEIMKGGFY
jgi:hypothetical protein